MNEIHTTAGQLLINEVLPKPLRVYGKVIDKKTLMGILNSLATQYPKDYAEKLKQIKEYGDKYSYLLGCSYTLSDFKPVDLSPIKKKYEPLYNKVENIKDKKQREDTLREINIKFEADVNDLVQKEIKENPSKFSEWIASGARGGPADLRQIRYAVGNVVNIKNELIPNKIKDPLIKGLKPIDFYTMAAGARKGIVASFISVRDPGAFAKELYALTNDMVVTEDDCGVMDGKEFDIEDTNALDRCFAKDIGVFKRNQIFDQQTKKIAQEKNIKKVLLRTPIKCKAHEGVCAKCYGLTEYGTFPKKGDTIGLKASQGMAERLSQMALSEKHSGGVVRKTSPFQLVNQLSQMPKSFPGGAVLSILDGKIEKIKPGLAGGTIIIINGHEHILTPQQTPIVSVGQTVKKGDPISTGLVNPAQIVEYKGLEAGRESWANSVHQVYNEVGIKAHSKIFETVGRAVINHAKVEDPGDHNLDHGQIVRYNQYQHLTQKQEKELPVIECVGWRLNENIGTLKKGTLLTTKDIEYLKTIRPGKIKVYKEPAKFSFVALGTEQGALNKDDWLSNMGFRYLKDTLKENVALGRESNIHSYDPIPAFVYGAEFGKGEGGRF